MGIVNAQRSLSYIRTLTEFIMQPEYSPMVGLFMLGNEIALLNLGDTQVKSFYVEAYNMVRNITGIGAGKGPMISLHDGFVPANTWPGFMTGADRIALGELSSLEVSDGSDFSLLRNALLPRL
jgi:glucan 1,3-beta-glucosidase